MPRNLIINRLYILVIIIYRLYHCWHASYKECLCHGQLGCVSIIRISSGLLGVQKSSQDKTVCPLHPSHSKHIDSLCKLSECMSEYQQQHSLIISVSTTAWLDL